MQEKSLAKRIWNGWSRPFGRYEAEAKDVARASAFLAWETITGVSWILLLGYSLLGSDTTRLFVSHERSVKYFQITVVLFALILIVLNYVIAKKLKPYGVKGLPNNQGILIIATFLLAAIFAMLFKLPDWTFKALIIILFIWMIAAQFHFLRLYPKPQQVALDPKP